jgi:sialidase-1
MLTETSNGSVIMMLRPNNSTASYHYNYVSYSNDGGITSSEPKLHPDLISPICQVSIIPFLGETATTTDDLLLYSGPDSQTERVKMTIKISQDNGQTWNQSRLIFKGKSGYSDLVVLNSTHVGCLFENGRFGYHDQVSFVVCNVNWLQGN